MLPVSKILRRALAFAALFVVLSWSNASAQQAQPSPLEFVETGPLVLVPGEAAQLELRNNTSRTLKVSVQVIDLKQEDPDLISKHVSISPAGGFDLKPAAGIILTATLAGDYKITPSRSVAYLGAFESETNTFARRIIQLRAADSGGGTPKDKPLKTFSTSWSATGYYSIGETLSLDKSKIPVILNTYLPLGPDATTGKFSKDKPLAILFNEVGDPGVIQYEKTVGLLGDLQGVQLVFKGAGCCGKYKGKINKDVGTEKDDVDVTVVMSHHWLYPLLMLLFGVGVAFYFRERYMGVSRPLLVMEERLAQIEYDFEQVSEPNRYSIEVAFNRMVAAIGAEMRRLRDSSFSTLDAEALKKVQASLDDLRRLTDEWSSFRSYLAALEAARTALIIDESTPRPYWTSPDDVPAIYTRATDLLNNGAEMDVAAFRQVNSSVVSLTALLKGWAPLNQAAAKLWSTIHKPGPLYALREITEDKKIQLNEVNRSVEEAWYDLWKRDDYKNEEIRDSLLQSSKTIELLSPHFKDTTAEAAAANRSFRTTLAMHITDRAELAQQRAQGFRSRRLILDSAFVLISLAVAIYTGFSQLYIGQAFGTLQDYIKIFLWGFGVQTTLTAVLMGLNLLWNSRSSLRLN